MPVNPGTNDSLSTAGSIAVQIRVATENSIVREQNKQRVVEFPSLSLNLRTGRGWSSRFNILARKSIFGLYFSKKSRPKMASYASSDIISV